MSFYSNPCMQVQYCKTTLISCEYDSDAFWKYRITSSTNCPMHTIMSKNPSFLTIKKKNVIFPMALDGNNLKEKRKIKQKRQDHTYMCT